MFKRLTPMAVLFLLGIFVSSLGSSAFVISLLTFPAIAGISALPIGLIIGSARMTSVVSGFFAGPIGDYVSPKKIVFVGEFCALVCSAVLWKLSFSLSDSSYIPFLLVTCARSLFIAIQTGSTQKIGKIFDDSLALDGRFAKYLNRATFGSIFFAMGVNLLAMKFGSFQQIIVIDAITFLINGVLVLMTSKNRVSNSTRSVPTLGFSQIWRDNFNYYKHHKYLADKDVLLAAAMMGANTLNVVLLAKQPELTPLASGIFGLAVWLSGLTERLWKASAATVWISLGVSIFAQGALTDHPVLVLAFALFRNLAYWNLFNDISSEIMKGSKQEGYAGVASGRNMAINVIGALGEGWAGLKLLPTFFEMMWRAFACFGGTLLSRKKLLQLQ